MASLTGDMSPYDVLTPTDLPAVDSPTDTSDTSTDDVSDVDQSGDDSSSDDAAADDTDAEASDEDADSAEGGDLDPQAAIDDDAAWKAKDGNLPPALKEIIAANPKAAQKIRDMYFTNQRLMKFGSAGELRKMKEAVEHVGGVEKLLDLQNKINTMGGEQGFEESMQELGAWRDIDSKWTNGDTSLADHLASVNPDSFEKIAPAMFSKLYDVNPELYNNLGAQLFYNTLAQSGALLDFQLMEQAITGNNLQLAKQYFDKVKGTFGGITQLAQQAPKTRQRTSPESEKFKSERQTFEQERTEVFQNEVTTTNAQWMDSTINKELDAYLGTAAKGLSDNTKARLNKAIKEEIWNNHLANNDKFTQQREALKAKRDKDGIVRLYHQYSDKLFPTVARQIAQEFGLKPGGKKAAAPAVKAAANAPGTKTAQGWQRVTKFPTPQEVDNRATTFDMKTKNQFVLKDGRKIQVAEPTVRQ